MSDEPIMEPFAPLIALGSPFGPMSQVFPQPSYTGAAAAWPAAARAIFVPITVHNADTLIGFSINVGAASGNMAIGLFDDLGNRIVQSGDIAVPAAGFNFIDTTDTLIQPGDYWIGFGVSNITATFINQPNMATQVEHAASLYQMAAGWVTGTGLVATATYAKPSSSYVPACAAHFAATAP